MENKQSQKAGDHSQQLQAGIVIVNNGIDEKRAREIYQEMNLQLRKNYTQEALVIANSRVSAFEDRLLPKMEAVEGALEAFADPSFQLLLLRRKRRLHRLKDRLIMTFYQNC
jgi:F420-0:gamma-glutamyl ligase